MMRLRFALLALFVAVSATACDGTQITGNMPSCGGEPTMGSGC